MHDRKFPYIVYCIPVAGAPSELSNALNVNLIRYFSLYCLSHFMLNRSKTNEKGTSIEVPFVTQFILDPIFNDLFQPPESESWLSAVQLP